MLVLLAAWSVGAAATTGTLAAVTTRAPQRRHRAGRTNHARNITRAAAELWRHVTGHATEDRIARRSELYAELYADPRPTGPRIAAIFAELERLDTTTRGPWS